MRLKTAFLFAGILLFTGCVGAPQGLETNVSNITGVAPPQEMVEETPEIEETPAVVGENTSNNTLKKGATYEKGDVSVNFGGIYESAGVYKAKLTVTNGDQTETKYLEGGVLDTIAGVEIYVNLVAVAASADETDVVKVIIGKLK